MSAVLRQTTRAAVRLGRRSAAANAGARLARHNSTEAKPVDPKIAQIVDQISTLTLLETSYLIQELKTKLNIPDIAFPAAGAAAPAPAAAEAQATEAKEEVQEKTIFNVKLESFDAKAKPKIIKEVKSLLGLSLVESKKFVEGAPKVIKENVSKEDAEQMKATLEGLGAKIVLE
ncbi:hypothetical protein KL930_004858 [Ogataea haglerorum]|uniref:Uncharacterized protein n=1 Tax=Ogataea haglerorum TaxID=1937702 RepID=A0AAN6D1T6_9ASCO|nr:hypothetical protein KL951_004596 [Ogataea haglerorum]KAG7693699.1 hypothetical protein KL915_003989 [Ogataea haglerorum]KAG7703300.1 hypothetical protein KL914_004685 [Ogataea haglerorum]KAG7703852.1 hypothetical protein KL950_004649 [Ogataea haglerorum]KAG7714302.1 hypothetical protein KL913_004499 [Ogataea haglerorum]